MEIIPAIDLRGGQCVRLQQGDYNRETVFAEDPVEMARHWVQQGAPRLHLVDLDGAKNGRPVHQTIVTRIVQTVGVPCQFGGGLRDDSAVRMMLEDVGVNRIVIGTQALKEPEWFRRVVELYPHRVVLGLDARGEMVATEGWLHETTTSAVALAGRYRDLPLAALIYTNIANDGMLLGQDDSTLHMLRRLCETGLPVIASGGVTTTDDIRRLKELSEDCPSLCGAIVGRALYEGVLTLSEALAAAA